MGEVTPPDDMSKVTSIGTLYFHTALSEYGGLISLSLSMLPKGVQCEMGKNCLPPVMGTAKKATSSSGGKGAGGSEGEDDGGVLALGEALSFVVSKNNPQNKSHVLKQWGRAVSY